MRAGVNDSGEGDGAASGGRSALVTRRRAIGVGVPVVGLVAAVVVLVLTVDVGEALRALWGAAWGWVALAAGLAVVQTGLSAVRLWLYARAAGERPGLGRCWSAVMASLTLNAVIPGRGGDLIKAVFLADAREQVGRLLGATLLERVVDVLVLACLALAGALWLGLREPALIAAAAACVPVGAFVALRWAHRVPVVGGKLVSLGAATRGATARPGLLAGTVAFCVGFWGVVVLVMWCLLNAVDAGVGYVQAAATGPLAVLVGIVPVSVSGIGTRDGAWVWLLRDIAEPPRVLAAGLLYTVVAYWWLALIGVAGLGRETLRKAAAARRGTREELRASDRIE